MLLRSHRPGPPLSDFIENFWLYEGYDSSHARERILPSGTFELVFNLRNDELRIYDAGGSDRCERYSGAIVSGPYSGFFVTDAAEEASVMGVHFKPGGAFPFLQPPAQEFADSHVDLETIWGRKAREVHEQLCASALPEQRFSILERSLRSRWRCPTKRNGAVSLALHSLTQPGVRNTIRDLAWKAGLSEKRLIDLFRLEVGLSPKLFHRVQRFQRVLASVQGHTDAEWAQLSTSCGYFDQSHLIRDFLAFSGLNPSSYQNLLRELRMQGQHVKFNHLPLSA